MTAGIAAEAAACGGGAACCCCFSMRSVTELGAFSYRCTKDIKRHRIIKVPANMVVNLVQKVLPLVPKRLWPVPENNPAEVLGCWIKTTLISTKAFKINRIVTMTLMGSSFKSGFILNETTRDMLINLFKPSLLYVKTGQ